MTNLVLSVVFVGLFVAVACYAAFVDVAERRLPNGLTRALAALALAQGLLGTCGLSSLEGLPPFGVRLAWAAGTLVVLTLVEGLWRSVNGGSSGLGGGDIKFLAAVALWVGPGVLAVLAVSCLLALPVSLIRRVQTFAMGPYLAFSSGAAVVACGCGLL